MLQNINPQFNKNIFTLVLCRNHTLIHSITKKRRITNIHKNEIIGIHQLERNSGIISIKGYEKPERI